MPFSSDTELLSWTKLWVSLQTISKYCQTPTWKMLPRSFQRSNRLLGQIFSRLQLGYYQKTPTTKLHQHILFLLFSNRYKEKSTWVTWGKRTAASSRKSIGLFINQMQHTLTTSALNTQLNVKHLVRACSMYWISLTSIILTQVLFSKLIIVFDGKTTTSSDALTSLQTEVLYS